VRVEGGPVEDQGDQGEELVLPGEDAMQRRAALGKYLLGKKRLRERGEVEEVEEVERSRRRFVVAFVADFPFSFKLFLSSSPTASTPRPTSGWA
jgi:hypothetical protein